jgi:toxin ParE1/3/4
MREVVMRPRAEADIDSIVEYTKAEWGEPQAKRYLDDLRRQIDFAAEIPGIGSQVVGLPGEYRKIRSGAHRVIYRCLETELIVVRVIHEREDVPSEIEEFW